MAMVVAGRSAAQKAGDVQRAFRSQSARAVLPDAFAAATVRAFEKAEMRAPTSGGIASQTTWASRALGPIAREALDLIPDAAQLPNSEWSELLFRLHGALGDPSTRLRALTEDLTAYERMAVRVRVEQTGRPSLGVPRRWWTRPGFVGGVLISFGIVVLAVVLFVKFEATRTRVQSGLAGLALAWSGIAYVVMGPLGLRPAATEDSEIDTDEGMFEARGPPGDSTAAEVAALQAEVAQLRSGGAAPPPGAPPIPVGGAADRPEPQPGAGFEALQHFAAGTVPTGPVSQTAAAQGGAAGAPLPTRVPPAVPPAAPGLCAPLAAESVASQAAQAGRLLAAWTLAASRRSLDVQWFSAFWDAVLEEKRGIGLLPGKEALLMSYGFNPNGSCGAPGSGLEAELAQISVGTTATAPAAAASGAVLPGILGSNGGGDSRFDTRLPSSMRRAAPEIYVNLRCQASASVRD